MADVREGRTIPVPRHLRDGHYAGSKRLGNATGYQYAHDVEGKIADMQCLPDNLRDRTYYHPTNEGVEKRIRERMEEIKCRRSKASGSPDSDKEQQS